MPQPLLTVKADAKVVLFAPQALLVHPDLAVQVAFVIASWSHTDSQLGLSLARLLGSSAEAGVAMYMALTGSTAQRAALSAAAQFVLIGENLHLFQAIMSLAKAARTERSAVAHGLWGTSPDIPDGLLWVEASDVAKHDAQLVGFPEKFEKAWEQRDFLDMPKMDRANIQVYRAADFAGIIHRIDRIAECLVEFWSDPRPNAPDSPRRQKLYSAPDIQIALHRILGQGKSIPSPPPQSPPQAPRGSK